MTAQEVVSEGLDGVVVARTRLSHVDGQAGRLVVCGRSIEDLTGRVSFEELAARLLADGSKSAPIPEIVVGRASPARTIQRKLGEARVRAYEQMAGRTSVASQAMDELRERVASYQVPENTEEHIALVGAVAVATALHARRALGHAPVAPNAAAAHAEDLLRMILGDTQNHEARAKALESYLVTVADHGMNASTFAARVVTSTGSDSVSAVTAAIGALKGPLHGGAPGPVLDMLDAIGSPDRAEAWLESELASNRRIMGMGHRIYRVRDPRAAVLERALGQLEGCLSNPSGRLQLARAVEAAALGVLGRKYPSRGLQANVEFYTAVLLDAIGLPRSLFSALFACGRVAGWCAHIAEQRARGRLIRPESIYDGAPPPNAIIDQH